MMSTSNSSLPSSWVQLPGDTPQPKPFIPSPPRAAPRCSKCNLPTLGHPRGRCPIPTQYRGEMSQPQPQQVSQLPQQSLPPVYAGLKHARSQSTRILQQPRPQSQSHPQAQSRMQAQPQAGPSNTVKSLMGPSSTNPNTINRNSPVPKRYIIKAIRAHTFEEALEAMKTRTPNVFVVNELTVTSIQAMLNGYKNGIFVTYLLWNAEGMDDAYLFVGSNKKILGAFVKAWIGSPPPLV